jgi:hypothetical protein
MTPSAKFAFAQLDPFDSNSNGAKIPDSNTIPSIANSDVDLIPMAGPTTSGNLTAMAFRPQYTWSHIPAIEGVTLGWGGAYATQALNRTKRPEVVSAFELIRPVAHAVRLCSPLAPTAATGFVHLGISTETNYAENTWTFPQTTGQMAGLAYYKRVTLASLTQSPITFINKWIDDTGFRYSSPVTTQGSGSGVTFQSDFGWGVLIVMLEGAPNNATALSAEHLLLSEGIPQKTGVLIGTPAAANSPGTLGAVGVMSVQQEPFHTEAEQDSYIQQGVNALARGAAQAGEAVFQNVAAPLLSRAGSAAVNTAATMAYNAIIGRGGLPGVNSNPNRLVMNRLGM